MREHMTMTNAQAALIAAANAAVRGTAVPVEPVLKRAAAYLQWLEGQDKAEPVSVTLVREVEAAPAAVRRAITQCTSTSNAHTRCLLAAGHELPHRNSTDGVHWDDEGKERKPRSVHFVTAPGDSQTVCGRRVIGIGLSDKRKTTTTIAEVTCEACRAELNL